ncbi:MAG: hypothetical protein FJ086_00495 [Deltaproteobacteria bacterium]|nr:hypothetical protein [Deltaproteobacteria bacterium]
MHIQCPRCGSGFLAAQAGAQSCPACHHPFSMVAVPVGQAGGVPPAAQQGGVAWERRAELGWVRAYGETWTRVMASPSGLYESAAQAQVFRHAFRFDWETVALGGLLAQVPGVLARALGVSPPAPGASVPGRKGMDLLGALYGEPALALMGALPAVVTFPAWFLGTAGVVHAAALVPGAPRNGFTATVRALGYGAAPLALGGVPCVSFPWLAVTRTAGMPRLQVISLARAAFTLALPLLVPTEFCCGVGWFVLEMAAHLAR